MSCRKHPLLSNYNDMRKIQINIDRSQNQGNSPLVDVMPSLQPFTGEMWSFLLVNALRNLTEEQRAGLCFDIYCRNELTVSIDKKIELLKLERKSNEVQRCR